VCISLGLEHVLWPLCGCGHLCLLVVLCCDASLVDVLLFCVSRVWMMCGM